MRLLPPHLTSWLATAVLLLTAAAAPAHAQEDDQAPAESAPTAAAAVDPADAQAASLKEALAAHLGSRVDKLAVSVAKPKEGPKDWQEQVDRAMAGVNGVIASFFFYPVFEASHSAELAASLDDSAALQAAVDAFLVEAAAEGVPVETAALTLTIPGTAWTRRPP